jgi:predicted dehydrogenase
MVRRGDVGEITGVSAEMSLYQPPRYREWLRNFGGGAQFIFGCHLADLVVSLMGKPKKVTSFLTASGQDGVDVPDVDLSVLEYERALARIYVSSLEIGGMDRRQFTVSGSEETVCICPLERPTTMWYAKRTLIDGKYRTQKETIPVEDPTKDGRYDDMMRAFHAYVTGREENPYSYEHEYAVQEVLDAMVGGIAYHGRDPEAAKPTSGGK